MNRTDNLSADYKTLSIFSIAMMMGIVFFLLLSLVVHFINGSFIKDKSLLNIFFILSLILGFLLVTAASIFYKKRIEALKESNLADKEKLKALRSATIVHAAFRILFIFFSGSYVFF